MSKIFVSCVIVFFLFLSTKSFSQSDSIVLRDLVWDKTSPAGTAELFIPSANSLLAGFMYKASGSQKHPTLLLLHGYPGNERNLDIAQVVRSQGWNVIYFDYRGSWGSQGKFSFKNCIEDVKNVVSFCNRFQDSLKIDTSNVVMFAHSMGGLVGLKALQQLPQIKKAFVLSVWDAPNQTKRVLNEKEVQSLSDNPDTSSKYFVLNATLKEIFDPVFKEPSYFNLARDGKALAEKQIVMLDESDRNQHIAEALKSTNRSYFSYEVWVTDHSFTNKRVSLINKVLWFINK
jgi:pimeloyl-ACP methyl ester carboxylesterase